MSTTNIVESLSLLALTAEAGRDADGTYNATMDAAAAEVAAIRHAAKVMLSPQDFTLDEYVNARDLIKALAKEES